MLIQTHFTITSSDLFLYFFIVIASVIKTNDKFSSEKAGRVCVCIDFVFPTFSNVFHRVHLRL